MTDNDYELLSRYIDGELDDALLQRLQRRLAAEPELRATLDELNTVQTRLQESFSAVDAAPEHIVNMLKPARDNVVAFPGRKSRPAWHYAIAASLVAAAGLVLAPQWQDNSPAGTTFATVLESSPSSAQGWHALEDGRQLRPILSFQDTSGNWCREYLAGSATLAAAERGVACRHGSTWTIQVSVAADVPGSDAEFRPAGAADADAVAEYLADHAAGIALSRDEEQALISSNWQR
jgi:hypothetical protein